MLVNRKQLECEFCKTTFSTQICLKIHKKFACKVKNSEEQLEHFKKHECKVCHRKFRLTHHLFEHEDICKVKSSNEELQLKYECEFCKRKFITKHRVFVHQMRKCKVKNPEKQLKRYQCEFCKRKFCYLDKHQKVCKVKNLIKETGEKNECEHCKAQFSTKRSIKRHQKLHCLVLNPKEQIQNPISVQDIESELCDRKCDQTLVNHQEICNVEDSKEELEDYSNRECKFCNRKFDEKNHFDNHQKTCKFENSKDELELEDYRKYECEFCNRKFHKKNQLVNHQKTCKIKNPKEGSERIFECESCNKKFTTKRSLTFHKKKCCKVKTLRVLRSH